MSPDEYESEMRVDRAETASVLSGVADGVLAGSIRLGEGPESTSVAVPDEVDLEIEFETEPGAASLELELEWSVPEDAAADASPADSESAGPDREAPTADSDTASASDVADREAPAGESAADQDAAETGITDPVGAAEPTQSLARFEVFRDRADEWRWRLRHRNGNVIASSGEGYTRKHNAWKGLRSVMTNAPGAEVTEIDG